MRATPSIDQVSGTGYYRYTNGTNVAVNEFTLDIASNTEITFAKGSITVTQGQSGMLLGVNSAAYFALSAEL